MLIEVSSHLMSTLSDSSPQQYDIASKEIEDVSPLVMMTCCRKKTMGASNAAGWSFKTRVWKSLPLCGGNVPQIEGEGSLIFEVSNSDYRARLLS